MRGLAAGQECSTGHDSPRPAATAARLLIHLAQCAAACCHPAPGWRCAHGHHTQMTCCPSTSGSTTSGSAAQTRNRFRCAPGNTRCRGGRVTLSMVLTPMHFDGRVHDIVFRRNQRFVMVRRLRIVTDNGHFGGKDAVADAPDVQIGNAIGGIAFD